MKKIILGAFVMGAMGMGLSSCGCGDKCAADNDSVIVINQATSDSLAVAYGKMVGTDINAQLKMYAEETGEVYDKKAFIKGLQLILGEERDDAFYAGVNSALRILGDVRNYEQNGVKFDRAALMRELRNAIMEDSVDEMRSAEVQGEFRALDERVGRMIQDAKAAKVANSPEGVQQEKTAEAIINRLKSQGVNLIKESTGAYSVVEVEGEGEPAKDNNVAVVDVVMSRLNNEHLVERADLEVIPGNNPIPGIKEGLQRVGKGGVVTVYVPGKVAFGTEGVPDLHIAPMEWVVYHITVKDIIVNSGDLK